MALFDDIVNGGNLVTGLGIGAGALMICPLVRPAARSIAKTLIKGWLIAYRETEQLYTAAVRGIGEMVQEAQQEIGATTGGGRRVWDLISPGDRYEPPPTTIWLGLPLADYLEWRWKS